MSRFVYVTTDADRLADAQAVHRAGCAHLGKIRREFLVPLEATDLAGALAEIEAEFGNDARIVSCARGAR